MDPAASATVAGDNIATTSGGGHVKSTTLNRVVSAQHCLKRIDSPAVLRADADRLFQVRSTPGWTRTCIRTRMRLGS